MVLLELLRLQVVRQLDLCRELVQVRHGLQASVVHESVDFIPEHSVDVDHLLEGKLYFASDPLDAQLREVLEILH